MEEIESIIFNLTNNIDILETNKKIEAYKKDNREQIRSHTRSGRLGKDEVEIEILLEQEKEMTEMRKQALGNLDDLTKKKTNYKEKLIDELMFSTVSINFAATKFYSLAPNFFTRKTLIQS